MLTGRAFDHRIPFKMLFGYRILMKFSFKVNNEFMLQLVFKSKWAPEYLSFVFAEDDPDFIQACNLNEDKDYTLYVTSSYSKLLGVTSTDDYITIGGFYMEPREIIKSPEIGLTQDAEGNYIVSKQGYQSYKIRPTSRTKTIIRILDARCEAQEQRYKNVNETLANVTSKLDSIQNNKIYRFFHTFGLI